MAVASRYRISYRPLAPTSCILLQFPALQAAAPRAQKPPSLACFLRFPNILEDHSRWQAPRSQRGGRNLSLCSSAAIPPASYGTRLTLQQGCSRNSLQTDAKLQELSQATILLSSLSDLERYEIRLRVDRRRTTPSRAITAPTDLAQFAGSLEDDGAEHLYSVYFDMKHRVVGTYLAAKGGIGSTSVDIREIYKAALVTNSPAFALVHNHPSGDPTPSPRDQALVSCVQAGAQLLQLEMLDFLVIGEGRHFSFKEMGLL